MYETIKIEGNREYYYNNDNKLVFRYADKTIGYRESEICYPVAQELDRARAIYRYPTTQLIDNVINMQNDESVLKARRYIKYKLLGECSYSDVFCDEITKDIEKGARDNIIRRIENIEEALGRIEDLLTGNKRRAEDLQANIIAASGYPPR